MNWQTIFEFIGQNWVGLLVVLVVGIVLICVLRYFRYKKKASIAFDIHQQRKQLRELDSLLGDLERYFGKIERRFNTK